MRGDVLTGPAGAHVNCTIREPDALWGAFGTCARVILAIGRIVGRLGRHVFWATSTAPANATIVRFSGPEVGWALRKRTCGGRAFEAHDMPSLHAPQGPGGFLGPFTVVDVTTAVFAGQEPAQLSMPLEMAQRGGTTISGRGIVANIQTALGIDLVSATKGWADGEAQWTAPMALFHRTHTRRRKEMVRPV